MTTPLPRASSSCSSGSEFDERLTAPVTRQGKARQDVFDYIEMFYNPKRRHSFSNDMSPVEYEKQYFQRLSSV